MQYNEITGTVIDTAINIHRKLGPGLFESVYRKVLGYELRKRGFDLLEEYPIPVVWDNVKMDIGFRVDLIVCRMVILELKPVEAITPIHKKQLLTYLRLADMRLGLLINFGQELLKDGIYRIVNDLPE
jgi:GxxExxY protein